MHGMRMSSINSGSDTRARQAKAESISLLSSSRRLLEGPNGRAHWIRGLFAMKDVQRRPREERLGRCLSTRLTSSWMYIHDLIIPVGATPELYLVLDEFHT